VLWKAFFIGVFLGGLIMSREELKLIEPESGFEAEFRSMVAEYTASGETKYAEMYAEAVEDYNAYIARLKDHAKGINLPQGWVRDSTYWLVRGEGDLLGCSRLRYELNDFLRYQGGHIGFEIRPCQRGNGYGTMILDLTLEKARQAGFKKVLLLCHTGNKASARIIEKNGGKFTGIYVPDWPKKPLRRYWIKL
jgi:predicted acetyltransferase